ncbi:Protein of unknown function, partial [Gryllus bimaculatus]
GGVAAAAARASAGRGGVGPERRGPLASSGGCGRGRRCALAPASALGREVTTAVVAPSRARARLGEAPARETVTPYTNFNYKRMLFDSSSPIVLSVLSLKLPTIAKNGPSFLDSHITLMDNLWEYHTTFRGIFFLQDSFGKAVGLFKDHRQIDDWLLLEEDYIFELATNEIELYSRTMKGHELQIFRPVYLNQYIFSNGWKVNYVDQVIMDILEEKLLFRFSESWTFRRWNNELRSNLPESQHDELLSKLLSNYVSYGISPIAAQFSTHDDWSLDGFQCVQATWVNIHLLGRLYSLMTNPQRYPEIDSMDQLAASELPVVTFKYTWRCEFQERVRELCARSPTCRRFPLQDVLLVTIDEFQKMVTEDSDMAFLVRSDFWVTPSDEILFRRKVHVLKEPLSASGKCLGITENWPWKHRVEEIVSLMKEAGLYQHAEAMFIHVSNAYLRMDDAVEEGPVASTTDEVTTRARVLQLADLLPHLELLLAGLLLAALCLGWELTHRPVARIRQAEQRSMFGERQDFCRWRQFKMEFYMVIGDTK